MKLTALGTPAVSTQTLPYIDATQKGIEINSGVLVNITAPSVAMTGAQAIVSGTVKSTISGASSRLYKSTGAIRIYHAIAYCLYYGRIIS